MQQETLKRIVELHGKWLRGEDGGERADLRFANLRSADLRSADLRSAKLAWQSHDLLAEILQRAAGDDIEKLKIAGFVLVSRNKCWDGFLELHDPLSSWATGVLREWITDNDEHPKQLDTAVLETVND